MREGAGSSRPLPLHQNNMTPWFKSYYFIDEEREIATKSVLLVEFSHWCRITLLNLCVLTDHIVLDDLVHCKLVLTI